MSNAQDIRPTIQIEPHLPDLVTFKRLRAETAWGVPDTNLIQRALENSLFGAVAMCDDQTIGMIRVIGDGALNLYIQDVIVAEAYRGYGIGRRLVKTAIQWMHDNLSTNASVGLMAAEGQAAFYEEFGFIKRPGPGFGPGMHAQLSTLRQI